METSGLEASAGSIELYDINGRLVSAQKIMMSKENSTYKMNKPQQNGLYILYIGKPGEKSYVGKVMVMSN